MTAGLYVDSIRTMPRDEDWSAVTVGEGGDPRWTSFEAFRCETEGCPFVVVSSGGEVRCDEDSGTLYLEGQRFDPTCAEDDEPRPCGEYIGHAEGPMMSYAYPLDRADEDSAVRLADLPLALVEMDGAWFLALTGGGMDLSWEICAGYVRLGSYPPAHFAENLPRIGSMGNERAAWYADTLAAARESLRIAQDWAVADLERFAQAYGPAQS
jgi:hypothetical protein